jgi:anti-sigma regulatory factor (Ser/Thr protein kinase)
MSTGSDAEESLPCSLHGCGWFGHRPCDPLPHLASKLNHGIHGGPFSEVPVCTLLGLWTPATGRLQLLNAGIPHGLHCRRGPAETLPVELNGTPLGVFPEADLEGTTLQLEPGDRMLFGTDGFFEVLSPARRAFQDQAPGQWQRLAASPLDQALSAICEAARDHGAGLIADDLLVVGFQQPAYERALEELVLQLPSTSRSIDLACDRFDQCLQVSCGHWNVRNDRRFDVVLAVREALTNAVFHGNGSRLGARVSLRCRPEPDTRSMVVEVADEGAGFDLDSLRPPEDPLSERGRGIPLIRHHAQALSMIGNTMTMTFLLEENDHDDQ